MTRRFERLVDGAWVTVAFERLALGDVFRCFEADGTPVSNGDGDLILIARGFGGVGEDSWILSEPAAFQEV